MEQLGLAGRLQDGGPFPHYAQIGGHWRAVRLTGKVAKSLAHISLDQVTTTSQSVDSAWRGTSM